MSWLGFNTSVSGIMNSQRKLYTVNHNVSNSEREGYSRQRVNSSATVPLHVAGQGYIGTGIGVDSIERVRDIYLDKKFRTETASFGTWNIKADGLTQIEGVLRGSDEEGINVNLDEFFKSIEDLSTDPTDMAHRTAFRQRVVSLTETMNETVKRLYKQQKSVNFEVKTKIKEVNDYMDQIATINSEIFAMEVDGSNANDLRDQRDLLVDKLSKLVDIEAEERTVNVEEAKDGKSIEIKKFEVRIGGMSVVDHDMTSKLKYPPDRMPNPLNPEEPLYKVEWASGGEVILKSGEIKGLLEVRDGGHKVRNAAGKLVDADTRYSKANGIPYYIDKLDEFARVFADKMNRIHAQGTSLNGTKTIPLFDVPNGVKPKYAEIYVDPETGEIDISKAIENIANEEMQDVKNTVTSGKDLQFDENGNPVGYDEITTIDTHTYIAIYREGDTLGNPFGKLSEDGTEILNIDDSLKSPREYTKNLNLNTDSTKSFVIKKETKTITTVRKGIVTLPEVTSSVTTYPGDNIYELDGTDGNSFVIKPSGSSILAGNTDPNGLNNIIINKADNSFQDNSFKGTQDERGNIYISRVEYLDFIRDNVRADDIKVSHEILTDLNNIATISGDDPTDIENNGILMEIINAREQSDFFDDTASYQGRPEDYFTSILSTLGTDKEQAGRMTSIQEKIVKQATNQRLSVSGVNLDEEMADMVKFQQIFNASAKMLTTFDQIFDTVVNRLGMVGR